MVSKRRNLIPKGDRWYKLVTYTFFELFRPKGVIQPQIWPYLITIGRFIHSMLVMLSYYTRVKC